MSDIRGTILYIGGFEMPDKNAAAHRVMNNAKALRDVGYDVIFCGIDYSISSNLKEPVSIEGFFSWPTRYPTNTKEWCEWMLDFNHTKLVIENCSNIKCIIAYNMHAVPLMKLMKYCKTHQIKLMLLNGMDTIFRLILYK